MESDEDQSISLFWQALKELVEARSPLAESLVLNTLLYAFDLACKIKSINIVDDRRWQFIDEIIDWIFVNWPEKKDEDSIDDFMLRLGTEMITLFDQTFPRERM